MTNYLSTAMLSAGASCFGSIIEIEKNMSQAEINTLLASKQMMDVQPLLMTALQNSFEAQARDQFISGLIGGVSAIGAGLTQFGLTKMGDMAGDEAFNEDLETKQFKTTSEVVEPKPVASNNEKGTVEAQINNVSEERQVANESTNTQQTDQKVVAAKENEQKTAEETRKDNKLREQKRLSKIQTYQNYAQLAGSSINGAATAGRSYFDAGATRNAGSAQAMGSVIQGNQTAQTSNANLVQTYKEAFTNASQILAGIVSAQNH